MSTASTNSLVLFANTGVQILCVPFKSSLRLTGQQTGKGWQRCRCASGSEPQDYPYIQWQIVPGQNNLLLAVDTTVGPDSVETSYGPSEPVGYFCRQGIFQGDVAVSLRGLLGADGKPLTGLDPVDFAIKSATAEGGEPTDVHLVIDFGNTRTGGLLIEFRGDVAQEPLMSPLQLIHRYHLDAWDEKGELVRDHQSWWFSSRSHWCTGPYLDPPEVKKVIYVPGTKRSSIFGPSKDEKIEFFLTPKTFQDFSMVRLGRESHDLALVMRSDGEIRTGVSSPKRYLWAKDASWLEGGNWHMADPTGRYDAERHETMLKGPLLRYIPEDDSCDPPEPGHDETPSRPRHAPRVLMTGALYEILAQAYAYVNSPTYRRLAGDRQRMRRIRSVTLTYPSGMISAEREQLYCQARKAVRIFSQTIAAAQDVEPELHLSLDEASAVHLTYIWSEVQKLGRNARLWFSLVGYKDDPETAEVEGEKAGDEESGGEVEVAQPSSRRRGVPPVRGRRGPRIQDPKPKAALPDVRIACIDIGGGTSDLMIARYTCDAHAGGDRIVGETLHRDGFCLAGDHLIKRILERVIVPQFAGAVGLEEHDVLRLFGPEVPGSNREFRAQRINWINRLFVPLAQKYLQCAVDELEDEEISHHKKAKAPLVAEEVVASLQKTINEHWGVGHCEVDQPLGLYFVREEFEDIIHEVFGELLFDFCQSIVEYEADVVLLAGLPTKLRCIRELVQTYLPLPRSRIIPMYNRYVGTWYPYQNPDHLNPGVIVDPKSAVVVGAAVEFSARYGMSSQFKFRMKDEAAKRSYFWGVMTDSQIHEEHILFLSADEAGQKPGSEERVLNVSDRRLMIGRKRRRYENAQATPVYVIKIDVGQRLGEIDVNLTLVRTVDASGEEQIEVVAVQGEVAGEPADMEKNVAFEWRTLADERYYLDTGGLDKIEMGS